MHRQSNYLAALRDYEAALESDDEGAEVLTSRAFVYYWMSKHDKALADVDRAIRLNPEYVRAYYARGVIRVDAKQFGEGVADLDKAVALDPRNLTYRNKRLAVAIGQGDAARVEREQAGLERIATYVPRSDLPTQQTILARQAAIGDFYQTRGDAQRAGVVFQRANKRAEWVDSGLRQQSARNDWMNRLNQGPRARPWTSRP